MAAMNGPNSEWPVVNVYESFAAVVPLSAPFTAIGPGCTVVCHGRPGPVLSALMRDALPPLVPTYSWAAAKEWHRRAISIVATSGRAGASFSRFFGNSIPHHKNSGPLLARNCNEIDRGHSRGPEVRPANDQPSGSNNSSANVAIPKINNWLTKNGKLVRSAKPARQST
jgi:hypothetical protein